MSLPCWRLMVLLVSITSHAVHLSFSVALLHRVPFAFLRDKAFLHIIFFLFRPLSSYKFT